MSDSTADSPTRKFRYAPTPSGFLHEGNICNFILTRVLAKANHGRILLRIDDLDRERFRNSYLEDIFRQLDLFGLEYDEGPSGPDDFLKNWSQHSRIPLYQDLIRQLLSNERVFACVCSRKDIESGKTCSCHYDKLTAHEVPLRYNTEQLPPVSWKDELAGAVNIDVHAELHNFILRKKDGLPSYQATSLADDIHFKITDIVRGEDLKASTAAQLLLSDINHHSSFQKNLFYHHPLIHHVGGEKLSKSAGDKLEMTNTVRHDASTKIRLLRNVGRWLRLEESITSFDELLTVYLEKRKEG